MPDGALDLGAAGCCAHQLATAFADRLVHADVVRIQLLADDSISLLQHVQLVAGHGADDANGQARAGEGLTVHDVVGQPQCRAQRAHLVLEEVIQRLNQVKVHTLRKRNQVVVALDGGRLAAGLARAALDLSLIHI